MYIAEGDHTNLWLNRSEVTHVVLLRFVWSFLSYCSDRLELQCHELSLQNSSELLRILRTSTINSQSGVRRGVGWWVEGAMAYCRNALLSFWNCSNLPLYLLLSLPFFLDSFCPWKTVCILSNFVTHVLFSTQCLHYNTTVYSTLELCCHPGCLSKHVRLMIHLFTLKYVLWNVPFMCVQCVSVPLEIRNCNSSNS